MTLEEAHVYTLEMLREILKQEVTNSHGWSSRHLTPGVSSKEFSAEDRGRVLLAVGIVYGQVGGLLGEARAAAEAKKPEAPR